MQLSPAQQRTLDRLRRETDPVVFDGDEIAALIGDAEVAANELDRRVGDARLEIAKRDVSGILACEAHHLEADPFEWSVRTATGSVTHRAIQLAIHWRGDPAPAELVDEAIKRLRGEERSLSLWLQSCSPADFADLRGACQQGIVQFLESFPPLPASAAPVVEAKLAWRAGKPVGFRGRVDLMIGRPRGRESSKVFVDFKTGRAALAHGQDLRYYALLETLSRAVPPRAIASVYLDAAEVVVERVTVPALRSALERTLEAANVLVETTIERRPATRRPGFQCRWCSLAVDCPPGQEWLDADAVS